MTTSNQAGVDRSSEDSSTSDNNARWERHPRTRHGGSCRSFGGGRGNWSGFHIAAVIVGFMFFWPIGLVMLFWVLSGRALRDLPAAVRDLWHRARNHFDGGSGFGERSYSDNVVFNEYQRAQVDRIRELKAEIGERARRFNEFRESARRRADQDEFDRFMNGSRTVGDA